MATAIECLRQGVHRHGLAGSIRCVASFAGRSVKSRVYLHERHTWYALELGGARRTIALPPGLEVTCNPKDALTLLGQLPTIGQFEARERLASGAQLWILREGGQALYACWIFHGRTPVLAASGGWLALPPGVVCIEDSVTSERYRGRGLAPATWRVMAEILFQQGVVTMITKVADENVPSRRAVETAGFCKVASMKTDRICAAWSVAVQPLQHCPVSTFLIDRLTR
jgi:L-amino acid N-acyltransferase YncA